MLKKSINVAVAFALVFSSVSFLNPTEVDAKTRKKSSFSSGFSSSKKSSTSSSSSSWTKSSTSTPKSTPRPTPKPTPKPAPKPTPTPKANPSATATPKATPKAPVTTSKPSTKKNVSKPKSYSNRYHKNGSFVPFLVTAAGAYLIYQGLEDDGDPIYVDSITGQEVDDDDLDSLGVEQINALPASMAQPTAQPLQSIRTVNTQHNSSNALVIAFIALLGAAVMGSVAYFVFRKRRSTN